MLNINITPTQLVFKGLNDEMYDKLVNKFNIEWSDYNKAFVIKGKPEELFKVLYRLSCDYDIELY